MHILGTLKNTHRCILLLFGPVTVGSSLNPGEVTGCNNNVLLALLIARNILCTGFHDYLNRKV